MNCPALRRSSHDNTFSTTPFSGIRAMCSRSSTTLTGRLVRHLTRCGSGSPYLPDSMHAWACRCTMWQICNVSRGGKSFTRRGNGSRGNPAFAMRRILVGLQDGSVAGGDAPEEEAGLPKSASPPWMGK